jgi:hypothetical protein
MSEAGGGGLCLDHSELVALYVVLNRLEHSLDDNQRSILERIATRLYERLSVSEMEDIEAYYQSSRK